MGGNRSNKVKKVRVTRGKVGTRGSMIGPTESSKGHVVYERIISQPILRKWLDTNWGTTSTVAGVSIGNLASISSAGVHYSIGAIAVGTDRINRVGRSVRLTGFELRGCFNANQQNLLTAGSGDNVFRIMLYRLRSIDPLTSAANITANLFPVGDPITAIGDADDIAEVYFDKTITARRASGPSTGSAQWQGLIHESVRMSVPITYINTGAANVESNMVILSVWSDQSAANFPDGSASFRVFFEDSG